MKKVPFLLLFTLFFMLNITAQIGINSDNSTPDASAILDVKSTEKGMLVPRMTTTQREAISSPATGLLVFDNETGSFWFYGGVTWQELINDTEIPTGGTTGQILSTDGAGNLSWADNMADDMGNHTATQNISLGNYYLSRSGTNAGLYINNSNSIALGHNNPQDILHGRSGGNGTRFRVQNTGNGWAGFLSKNAIGEIFVGIQGPFDPNPGYFHIYDNVAGTQRMQILPNGTFDFKYDVSAPAFSGDGSNLTNLPTELPSGGSNGQYLQTDGSGTYNWATPTDNLDDADADPTNEIELPSGGSNGQFLRTNGSGTYSWATPADNDTQDLSFSGSTFSPSNYLRSNANRH